MSSGSASAAISVSIPHRYDTNPTFLALVRVTIGRVSIPHRYDTNAVLRRQTTGGVDVSIPHRYDTNQPTLNVLSRIHGGFNPS